MTLDATARFAGDARLRRHGFAIHARPRDGEPVWSRGGRQYPHSLALDLCRRAERKALDGEPESHP